MSTSTRPAANSTPEQLRLPSIHGFMVRADFTDGELSSDFGAVVLDEVDRRIGIIYRLTDANTDTRDARYITHSMCDLLKKREFQIASGYDDGNDANTLRADSLFKLATGRAPLESNNPLACGATHSRPGSFLILFDHKFHTSNHKVQVKTNKHSFTSDPTHNSCQFSEIRIPNIIYFTHTLLHSFEINIIKGTS